jgi:hypothetical protein
MPKLSKWNTGVFFLAVVLFNSNAYSFNLRSDDDSASFDRAQRLFPQARVETQIISDGKEQKKQSTLKLLSVRCELTGGQASAGSWGGGRGLLCFAMDGLGWYEIDRYGAKIRTIMTQSSLQRYGDLAQFTNFIYPASNPPMVVGALNLPSGSPVTIAADLVECRQFASLISDNVTSHCDIVNPSQSGL